jgi:peflin
MDHSGPRRPSAPPSSISYGSYQGQNLPPPQGHDPYYGGQGPYHGRTHSNTVGARPGIPSPGPTAQPIANIPPAGTDAALFPIFRAVDSSGTGQLTEEQLGRALRNGDYSMFDPETVRLMIKMFDHDHSGTIGFEEFW